ncbi:MAG: RsmG family class I SAM-dependent methyltransferase, partial [Vampirovibrionales bacterium]|nr:RsmG family class I SAM-dependent methyltransferase [Vampirovibrionales bacterium]
ALGLQLALHAERAETCGRLPALRESFDVVTARALAAMPVLLELTTPLLKPGGEALFLKGPGVFEELDHARYALHELCCRVIETKAITLPLVGTQTVVVRVKKLANTPKIYPRKPGIPGKKPLS